ncbi:MAG TPA: hypothetical protein VKA37_04740 [Halobacteriales archaeon]|nr:hypothetical protein [Halobacteriales archaeon]
MPDLTRPEPDPADFPEDGDFEARAKFLLEYAVLAPSSHNSQPWRFAIGVDEIQLFADESRQLEVADPDGRELYLSVGCAIENLVVAAERFGFAPSVEYEHDDEGHHPDQERDELPGDSVAGEETDGRTRLAATVTLGGEADTSGSGDVELFDAVIERRTNHLPFEERAVPGASFEQFEGCVTGAEVGLEFVTESSTKADIAALQTRADERQFDDPEYRAELGHWIGTGALGANWIAARIGQVAVRYLDLGDREGQKNSKLLTSAPAVVVITAEDDDRTSRLQVGRTFERIALRATAADLAVHPMSQILEVPELRARLKEVVDIEDATPMHLFRVGFAESDSTRTPRRPVEAVLL